MRADGPVNAGARGLRTVHPEITEIGQNSPDFGSAPVLPMAGTGSESCGIYCAAICPAVTTTASAVSRGRSSSAACTAVTVQPAGRWIRVWPPPRTVPRRCRCRCPRRPHRASTACDRAFGSRTRRVQAPASSRSNEASRTETAGERRSGPVDSPKQAPSQWNGGCPAHLERGPEGAPGQ